MPETSHLKATIDDLNFYAKQWAEGNFFTKRYATNSIKESMKLFNGRESDNLTKFFALNEHASDNLKRVVCSSFSNIFFGNGANIDAYYSNGNNALHIIGSKIAELTRTINSNPERSEYSKSDKEKAVKIAQLLIEKGINVNHQDMNGNTPLANSIHNGLEELVEVLLESKKCDFSIKNNNGNIALETAMSYKDEGIVEKLKEYIKEVPEMASSKVKLKNISESLLQESKHDTIPASATTVETKADKLHDETTKNI